MPEKKNIFSLLAIAFVVAVVCTGVFYGLFVGKLRGSASAASPTVVVAAHSLSRGTVIQPSDIKEIIASTHPPKDSFSKGSELTGQTVVEPLKEGDIVIRSRVASPTSGAGAALGIPNGMRAVSVRTAETPGVTGLLRPGHRVDVQFVGNRPNTPTQDAELRTILQDVEVLAINPQQDAAPRSGTVVVTLLVSPADADLVGLADSNSRLRLVLRNPVDHEASSLNGVSSASLLHLAAAPAAKPLVNMSLRPMTAAFRDDEPRQVALSVQMIGAGPSALAALNAGVAADALQVMPVPASVDLAALSKQWTEKNQWEVLSASRLVTASGREVSVQASAETEPSSAANGLSVQLRPSVLGGGLLRLRVQPQLVVPQGVGTVKHRFASELDLSMGQSAVIMGFPAAPTAPLIDTLFPLTGSQHRQQQLVILVTPKTVRPARTAAAPAQGE